MIHESPDGGKTIKSREMNLPKGSNNSQTSTEWLFQKLWDTPKDKFTWYAILEQAKEMEKQQIIDAAERWKGTDFAEKYYAETYGSKGSDNHIVDTNEMVEDTYKVWECCGMEECICKGSDEEKTNSQRFDEFMQLVTSSQTEISDKEIEKASYTFWEFKEHTASSAWKLGAKWYREQLKQRQC